MNEIRAAGTGSDKPVVLLDLVDLALLQSLQDGFAAATGVASIITLPDGAPLTHPSGFSRLCRDVIRKTPKGFANCMRSDAALGRPRLDGPTMQPCLSCGLWDGGASIFAGQQHVANWLIGQVKNQELSEERILSYAREIGSDEVAFKEAFAEVTSMPTEQFRAVCDFLFKVANQISSLAYQRVLQRRQAQERTQLEHKLAQSIKLQAIGKLAGGVAHDFNNLLTTMLTQVELLELDVQHGRISSEQLTSALIEMKHAGHRAADLTRQLLAFSRQQASSPVLLDLNAVITAFGPMIRSIMPESVHTATAMTDTPALIFADRAQVEQVIMNLVVNARDSMPKGGTLTVTVSNVYLDDAYCQRCPEALPGAHVRLTVADTGLGMTPEVQARLFEPFFTTKAQGKGTGLGLATVYGLVSQADGHLTADSSPGHGSMFQVYWPAKSGVAASLAVPEPEEQQLKGTELLLVCEDSPQILRLTRRILENAGYRLLAAESGPQLLEQLEHSAERPQLLITDVVMPEMNGAEVAAAVRARLPSLPVLYVSGYTADVIAEHGILAEGVTLVEKPFDTVVLLRAVRRLLDAESPHTTTLSA